MGVVEDSIKEDPLSYVDALSDVDANLWLEAMKEEIKSMSDNKVWTLCHLPSGMRPVGCKWVFKRKINSLGQIEKFKARLVAKGYTQQLGVDYEETFSPVARVQSIRLMLAIVAHLDLDLYQMDVKTAFLNGNLDEEIYMTQPEGFIEKGNEEMVCKLNRSIYGLKQASRQWNLRFHESVMEFGFRQNSSEPCLYFIRNETQIILLALYVDDILLSGNDAGMLAKIKAWLFRSFDMKDLGEASYILGIKVERDRQSRSISLSQEAYVETVLKRFNMSDCPDGKMPFNPTIKFSTDQCPKTSEDRLDPVLYPYASAVGSIMYAAMCTRPDLAYTVGMLGRYQSNPGYTHWNAVLWALRYMKSTKSLKLCYQAEVMDLVGYTDSDYQGCEDTRKSTSGFLFSFCGGAVSWKSKKQDCIAQSTMEAEYVAMNAAAKEAIYLKKFLMEMDLVESIQHPVQLLCDNNSAISISRDPKCHSKAKHIEGRFHYIRDMIAKHQVKVDRVSSADNLADPFTKALSLNVFKNHVTRMGLKF